MSIKFSCVTLRHMSIYRGDVKKLRLPAHSGLPSKKPRRRNFSGGGAAAVRYSVLRGLFLKVIYLRMGSPSSGRHQSTKAWVTSWPFSAMYSLGMVRSSSMTCSMGISTVSALYSSPGRRRKPTITPFRPSTAARMRRSS